jgi:hypothetical protein
VQERAARLDGPVNLHEVSVVDAGDHHGIDLAEDAACAQHFEPEQLTLGQKLRGLPAGIALVVPEDPRVDVSADVRVDHIDRDRDVIDLELRDRLDVVGQREAVGRQTQLDVGRALRDEFERLEGFLRVGERVAGSGDAEHRHLGNRRGNREDFLRGLLGRELFADHARTRLVGAIVFSIAIVALDIAGGCDRDVHARIVVMRLFAIARMVLDLSQICGGRSLAPAPEPQLPCRHRRWFRIPCDRQTAALT